MKGGIFNRTECCNQPCEYPVCLANKICLEDIQHTINSNPRRLQKCPICRVLITNYGCNGNIINVGNNQNQQPYDEGEETDDETYINQNVNIASDDEGYETDDTFPMYGGKNKYTRKNKCTRKNKKKLNKRKTNRRRKPLKRKINKKKTKMAAF